ncbi:MAG: hypothetical protein R8J85_05310 [Mariprofundales bacterium]
MKLTVALGLQYDNNRPASVYALSVGGQRTVKPPDLTAEVIPEDGVTTAAATAPQRDRWLALTYNFNGIPVMLPPTATIDLFA